MDPIGQPVIDVATVDLLTQAVGAAQDSADPAEACLRLTALLRHHLDADQLLVFLPSGNAAAERVYVASRRGEPVSGPIAFPADYADLVTVPLSHVIRANCVWTESTGAQDDRAMPTRLCLPVRAFGRAVGALLMERAEGILQGEWARATTRLLVAQLGAMLSLVVPVPASSESVPAAAENTEPLPSHAPGSPHDLLHREILVPDTAAPGHHRERRFLAALIDALPSIIVIKDRNRRWVLVNRAACDWYGKPEHELLGCTDTDLHGPEVGARYNEEDDRAMQGDAPVIVEEQRLGRDGRVRWFHKTKYAFRLPDGRAFLAGISADVTDRKVAEQETLQARRFLDAVINGIPATVFVKNRQHRWVLANDRFCERVGLPREQVLGAADDVIAPPDIARLRWDEDDAAFASAAALTWEEPERGPDGRESWLLETKCAIRLPDGNDYLVGTQMDITRLKLAEKALRRSESRFRGTFEQAAVGLFHASPDGKFLRINRRFSDILGFTVPEMLRFGFSDITHPDDASADAESLRQLLSGEIDTYSQEMRYLKSDGAHVWVNLTMSLARTDDSKADYFIGVVEEITNRKHAEDRVQAALREKETLLKEIYHRVKNNMQVVSSLLQMQGRVFGDERFTAAIDDSVRRVQSMALVHEQLYRSKDLARVDFGEYMHTLVDQLAHSYHAHARGIRISADVLQAPMDLETAVPCGLIVSELVSNAFKHAFVGREHGNVMIRFRPGTEARHWVLRIADDGVGLPADFDITQTRSLGLRLVTTLTEQLSGTLEVSDHGGAVFTVTFLDEDKAK